MLQTDGTENKIFLQNWSQADRPKPFKGSGLTYHDKYYISEHIKNSNINLGEFKKYKRCSINDGRKAYSLGLAKSASSATKDNGITFEKTMLRNPNIKDINFYIFKNSEEKYEIDIVECVRSMFFSPEKTIKTNINDNILKNVEKYTLLKEDLKNDNLLNDKKKNKIIKDLNTLELKIKKDINSQIKNIETEKTKLSKISNSIEDMDYTFNIISEDGKSKELNIHLHVIDSDEALEQYLKGESVEDRIEKIEYAIGGKFKENSVALVELENLGKINDAKSIIRQSLNSMGVINQFVNPMKFEGTTKNASNDVIVDYDFEKNIFKYEHFEYFQNKQVNEYSNKVRKSVLELLVDFGLTDSSFSLGENTLYSFGILNISNYNRLKSAKKNTDELDEEDISNNEDNFLINKDGLYIPILCKMTDETIETKILLDAPYEDFDKWQHVSRLPHMLNKLKEYTKNPYFMEEINLNKEIQLSEAFLKVSNFIDNEKEPNKILLLSNINCGKLEHDTYKNIFSKNLSNTSLVFLEAEDTHYSIINEKSSDDNLVAFSQPSNFLYKVSDNIFKTVGQKPFGITATEQGFSRMIPSTQFKSRKLFKIEVISNTTNLDNEKLSYLIHRTRTSLTTNIHLNLDILTEYIYSSLKKVFVG